MEGELVSGSGHGPWLCYLGVRAPEDRGSEMLLGFVPKQLSQENRWQL